MGTVSTLDRARNIALEVASYRPDYDERHERIAQELDSYSSEASSGDVFEKRRALGGLAYWALDHSHEVLRQTDRQIAPRGKSSAVTRRTLTMTALAGTTLQPRLDETLDECCLGAELKFVHGLEHHTLCKPCRPSHAAALILHDVAGEPLAYQKAIGEPSAYVWRDGLMQTRAGQKRLFAGSIVQLLYDSGDNGQSPPHEKFAGHGLVGITGCLAENVEFKRLTLEFLPEKIRRAALLDASSPEAYYDYRCHVPETSAMNSAVFGERMAELAQAAKNYLAA